MEETQELLQQIEEARALRGEAEEAGDEVLIEEFSAVEARLEGLLRDLKQQAAAKSQSNALRERLKRLQGFEAKTRTALAAAGTLPRPKSFNVPSPHTPARPAQRQRNGSQSTSNADPQSPRTPTKQHQHALSPLSVGDSVSDVLSQACSEDSHSPQDCDLYTARGPGALSAQQDSLPPILSVAPSADLPYLHLVTGPTASPINTSCTSPYYSSAYAPEHHALASSFLDAKPHQHEQQQQQQQAKQELSQQMADEKPHCTSEQAKKSVDHLLQAMLGGQDTPTRGTAGDSLVSVSLPVSSVPSTISLPQMPESAGVTVRSVLSTPATGASGPTEPPSAPKGDSPSAEAPSSPESPPGKEEPVPRTKRSNRVNRLIARFAEQLALATAVMDDSASNPATPKGEHEGGDADEISMAAAAALLHATQLDKDSPIEPKSTLEPAPLRASLPLDSARDLHSLRPDLPASKAPVQKQVEFVQPQTADVQPPKNQLEPIKTRAQSEADEPQAAAPVPQPADAGFSDWASFDAPGPPALSSVKEQPLPDEEEDLTRLHSNGSEQNYSAEGTPRYGARWPGLALPSLASLMPSVASSGNPFASLEDRDEEATGAIASGPLIRKKLSASSAGGTEQGLGKLPLLRLRPPISPRGAASDFPTAFSFRSVDGRSSKGGTPRARTAAAARLQRKGPDPVGLKHSWPPTSPEVLARATEILAQLPIMSETDRRKCEDAYRLKGYERVGGVDATEASVLHYRSGTDKSFSTIFELADGDKDRLLNCREFCLYMTLLKAAKMGRPLPETLSPIQIERVLGLVPPLKPSTPRGGAGHSKATSGISTPHTVNTVSRAASGALEAVSHRLSSIGTNTSGESAAPGPAASGGSKTPSRSSKHELSGARSTCEDKSCASSLVGGYAATVGGPPSPPGGIAGASRSTAGSLVKAAVAAGAWLPKKADKDGKDSEADQKEEGHHCSPQLRALLNRGHESGEAKRALRLCQGDVDAANAWIEAGGAEPAFFLPPRKPSDAAGTLSPVTGPQGAAGAPNREQTSPASAHVASRHPSQTSSLGKQLPSSAASSTSPARREGSSRGRYLELTIDHADYKHRRTIDRPIFHVSLLNSKGAYLEPVQDTPPGCSDPALQQISAGHKIKFKTPISKLPPGSIVSVEVRQYKPQDRGFSVLAWAWAPLQTLGVEAATESTRASLKAGPSALNLLRKPVNLFAPQRSSIFRSKQLSSHGKDLHVKIAAVV